MNICGVSLCQFSILQLEFFMLRRMHVQSANTLELHGAFSILQEKSLIFALSSELEKKGF